MFEKLKRLFHKQNTDIPEETGELVLETETVEPMEDSSRFVREAHEVSDEIADLCEELVDAVYQIEDQRVEYDMLGAYFDDISRIEQMPENLRRELNDIAGKIEFLEKNQEEFKRLKVKLSDDKYRMITKYEKDVPDIMKQLVELETRNAAIKRDMQHLENEKDMQDYYTSEAEDRQGYLRSIVLSVMVMGVIAFVVIFWMYQVYDFAIEVTCMVTLFVITLILVILYLRYRSESYEIKLAQAKKQRAISLLNKVKIKYVNSESTLDYMYEKYEIKNLRELEYLWEQYNILLTETRKFQRSIGDMRVYFDEMERVLRDVNVRDPYIWTQQTRALLDDREMVEVKHDLNVRRQALRSQMETNEETKKRCLAKMKQMVVEEPALMENISDILATYHIEF